MENTIIDPSYIGSYTLLTCFAVFCILLVAVLSILLGIAMILIADKY